MLRVLIAFIFLFPAIADARRKPNLVEIYKMCNDMSKPSGVSLCVDMLTGWENDAAELDELREKIKDKSAPPSNILANVEAINLLQTKLDKCRMDMVLIKSAVKNIGEVQSGK